MEQRTLEWFRARLGKITGSSVGKLMGKGRNKDDVFSKTGQAYIYEVAAERMLLPSIIEDDGEFDKYIFESSVTNRAMQWGIDNEEQARFEYELATGSTVTETGSITHRELPFFASSPDGLVGYDGCLEIKCPKQSTFVEYLSRIKDADTLLEVEPNYYWQCQSHMAVTGRLWCDFVAFHPLLTKRLHIVRIKIDEKAQKTLVARVKLANGVITQLTN